ncbi:MAG: YihY/virulence factor BrkB family protein [Ilumatobacteraceae bacterium]
MKWLERVDAFHQRHRWTAVPFAVNKRFGEHDGSRLAATVSYYSFFSVFPLLLVFVTILGLVLQDNDDLRRDLLDSALAQIPLIGTQLTAEQSPLEGNVLALVIGLATAIWAGMAAIGALQQGLDEISDVPVYGRPNFAMKRLRSVVFLAALAVGLVGSVTLANLATLFGTGVLGGALGLVGTFIVNTGLVLAMFTVLPAQRRPVRELLPGAVTAGVGLVLLQLLGSFVVRRFIAGANDTYGTFAAVIALLSWFHLVSRLLLLSAQVNEVRASNLWPRRLVGSSPMTEGDRRAMLLDVQRVQRDPRVGYAVSVAGTVGTDRQPLGDEAPQR